MLCGALAWGFFSVQFNRSDHVTIMWIRLMVAAACLAAVCVEHTANGELRKPLSDKGIDALAAKWDEVRPHARGAAT